MSSPLEQAGATKEPSEYATLSMDRAITGLWTQRSPLRDADVPYLYGKFYSASRFDSLIDGINREITARLTTGRRAGTSVYNSQTFPACNSFYSYKRIVSGAEVVRVIADGLDGNIYDATGPSTKTTLFTKSGGAGKARFLGINTSLFFTDGVENKKYLQPAPWSANSSALTTQYQIGTIITDPAGKIEFLSTMNVGAVTNIAIAGNMATIDFSGTNFGIVPGMSFVLSGGTVIDGIKMFALNVTGSTVIAFVYHVNYASTPATGTATTQDIGTLATTGLTIPTFAVGYGGTAADGLSTWKNFGGPVFDWAAPGPTTPPNYDRIPQISNSRVWQPGQPFGTQEIVMSSNGKIQGMGSNPGNSGMKVPNFGNSGIVPPIVSDGNISWWESPWLGSATATAPQRWQPGIAATAPGPVGGTACIDSNGNIQIVVNGAANTGGVEPTWATGYFNNTIEGALTWKNFGPYLALAFRGWQYSYAYHSIDGSLSSLSPLSSLTYAVIAGLRPFGAFSTNPQVDSIYIFRTADGQSTPLFLANIPNVVTGGTWGFTDQLPDTNLIAQLPGTVGSFGNPPLVGMTAPAYHLQRIWGIYQNRVMYSNGPNTIVGNGNTGFAPLNSIPFAEQPIKLVPITVNNGGMLVVCTSNTYIIMGTGTASNPFYQTMYMAGVGILNYDALDIVGSTLYLMTGKSKAVSLDPSAGYVEYGFPIGDQFTNVTTGAGGKIPSGAPVGALYSPLSTFVAWAELGSGDSAVYVADGAVGWFRYSPIASPESGFLWSPRAAIVGGTSAVQSIITSPGIAQLLIGPASSGPILFRDPTVHTDWSSGAPQSFPSYDVKGNIVLCQSGEIAEIAHIGVKSVAVGKRPLVGLLLGEIAPTLAAPFDWLSVSSTDPPVLPPSQTMYSDRYTALQNGVCPKCDNFQLAIDYGIQAAADETLTFSVYGAKHAERKQQ